MKSLTKTQKIVGTILIALIVLLGGYAVLSSMGQEEVEIPETVTAEEAIELDLTLAYKDMVEAEYTLTYEGEEIIIHAVDISPILDTSKVGTTKHEAKTEDRLIDLTVEVVDQREITLNDVDPIVMEPASTTKEDLEASLIEALRPEVEAEDDALAITFEYPEGFNLDAAGHYEITAIAQFENNPENKTTKQISLTVKAPETVETVEEVEEPEETEVAPETEAADEEVEVGTPEVESETETLQPTVPVPPAIPSGAELVLEESDETTHTFNYPHNLPSGAKVEVVMVSYDIAEVLMSGQTTEKLTFMISFNGESLSFWGDSIEMSDEDMTALSQLGDKFLIPYGY